MQLKNPWLVLITILVILAAFALYRSEIAFQQRHLMEAFVLMAIAVIFVRRVQKRS